jgi:type IV secretory pathway TraG/TraD family ATPase VirD4
VSPGPDSGGNARARRYLSLALWAAVLLAPSVSIAAGLLIAGAAVMLAPAAWRAARRRRGRGSLVPAGGPVVVGADPAGRTVALRERQLAAHTLTVGASGAGKSTTMLTILDAQIRAGRPVIAIDMKGSPAFAAQLQRSAAAAGRGLRVWTPDGPGHWNPLAHGNATSLKDKLISTERFTEPHYQRAAERYVQIALGVLHAAAPDRPAQLHEVVAVMEPRRLAGMLRGVPGPLAERVQDYLSGLTGDQVSAVRGLGTRLALLSESCAGPYLQTSAGPPGDAIDLRAGLDGGDVILFSLNSSIYGKLAAQLGALAIQDLTSASGRRLDAAAGPGGAPPLATVAIDEFSALDGDNLLALLARGRESGVSVLMATQEMADLERAGRGFRDQVLGIVGVKIIHRQDVPASAETIAQMAGTERVWERTEQLRSPFLSPGASRGTRHLAERYVVHPNVIKTLPVGHAVILTKLPTAEVRRVSVRPPPASAPARHDRAAPPRGPGRDYPAPGVTR